MRSGHPIVAALGRLGVNLLLACGVAGITLLVGTLAREIVERPTFGPGIAGEWAVGMGTLLFGAPFVLIALGIVDFVLGTTHSGRRGAIVASLIPAALAALLIPVYPEIMWIAAWLLATGLLFGAVMRLPPSDKRVRDAVGVALD